MNSKLYLYVILCFFPAIPTTFSLPLLILIITIITNVLMDFMLCRLCFHLAGFVHFSVVVCFFLPASPEGRDYYIILIAVMHCWLLFPHLSLHQIGRSTESPIDFVVTDTVAGSQSNADTQSVQSTISRFACRIMCQRTPPYTARIYAAGFDSSKNIFLGVSSVSSGNSDTCGRVWKSKWDEREWTRRELMD